MSTANSKEHHHAHHFESADHEFASVKQGVWVFMATEILMFGGLFVAFAIFSKKYPEMFHMGSTLLNWKLGAVNTIVLLISSFTMANAIHQMQKGNASASAKNLLITILCALTFMVVKYFEYSHKFHVGLLPGKFFHADAHHLGLAEGTHMPANLALFFSFYFVMTGLHGLHVLVGIGLITWIYRRVKRGYYSEHYYNGIEGVGLYWHIVDIVWIYLFPLVYLVS